MARSGHYSAKPHPHAHGQPLAPAGVRAARGGAVRLAAVVVARGPRAQAPVLSSVLPPHSIVVSRGRLGGGMRAPGLKVKFIGLSQNSQVDPAA
jgi:hypothetical protein